MIKTCLRCQTALIGLRADAVFCSRRCSGAERQRRARERDPGKTRAAWTRYSRTDKGTVTVLMSLARDRARDSGVPFELSRSLIEQKLSTGICEMSGIRFERQAPGSNRVHPFTPSIDRIVPGKGYVDSNVRLICFCVNRARSDWGDEVLMVMARALVATSPPDVVA